MRVLLSLAIFFLVSSQMFSQIYEPLYNLHIRGSIGPTYSLGSAPELPGSFVCSEYLPTFQKGYEVVATFERTIVENPRSGLKRSNFSVAASLGMSVKQFTFDAVTKLPIWDSTLNKVTTLSIQSDFQLQFRTVEVSFELLYLLPTIFPKSQTKVFVGFSGLLPIQTYFQQKESILTPRNATFVENGNPKRSIILAEGSFPDPRAFFFRTQCGISNSVLLTRSIELLQRLEFQVHSNPLRSQNSWLPISLQCSLGLSYTLPNSPTFDTPLSPAKRTEE